jgi:hypothetical protein
MAALMDASNTEMTSCVVAPSGTQAQKRAKARQNAGLGY